MKFYYLAIFMALFFFSCKKKDLPGDSSLPSIDLSITNTGSLVNFNAELKNLSLDHIKETGFIWSTNSEPVMSSAGVYSYSSATPLLKLNYELSAFNKDSTYYVKAFYVDDSNNYHFSTKTSFVAIGTKVPLLKIPERLYTWGDTVTLTLDKPAPAKLDDVSILIEPDIVCKPIKVTGNNINFIIPESIMGRYSSLYVSVYGQKSSPVGLSLNFPEITPTEDVELSDETLKISGKYFNPTLDRNIVKIGDLQLEVVSATTTELVVKANNLNLSESGKLTVQTGKDLIAESKENYFAYKYFKSRIDFPGAARSEAVTFFLEGNIYCGLGRGKESNLGLNDWWKYNIATNVWTKMADCPVSAWVTTSFSADNKGYIGLGILNGNYSNDFYCYSPTTNTWKIVASFPGYYTSRGSTFSTKEAGYLVGGDVKNGRSSEVWKYTPATNSWNRLPDFPGVATSFSNTFMIGNKGYYIGGIGLGLDYLRKDAWSFDFSSQTWKRIADIPYEAGSCLGFSFGLQGKGYIGSGTTNIRYTGDLSDYVYEYNPVTDSWKKIDKIFGPVKYLPGYTSSGDTGYIICGNAYEFSYHGGSQKFLQFKPR